MAIMGGGGTMANLRHFSQFRCRAVPKFHLFPPQSHRGSTLNFPLFKAQTLKVRTVQSPCASTASLTRVPRTQTSPEVQDILERIREALALTAPNQAEVLYSGTGWHMGVEVAWKLRCRPDGAFLEEIYGKEMKWTCGYDGGRYSKCWEVDGSGVSRHLELDDNESLLLSVWVRSGFWLNPQMSDAVGPRIVIGSQEVGGVAGDATVNVTAVEQRLGSQLYSPPVGASTSSPGPAPPPSLPTETTLALQLPNGKVVSMLSVDTETWRPTALKQKHFSDLQTWQFSEWQSWDARVHFPAEVQHVISSGGTNSFRTVEAAPARLASLASFCMPITPLRPPDTRFDGGQGSGVAAWWTSSGHLCVKPTINGRSPGYMLLDTGASGLVIEKSAADKLQLPAFGEVHVTSVAGKVKSQFRRGGGLRLGPLHMKEPVFMEMSLSNLVRGAPGPVIGIIGYEIFRRAVVTIPPAVKPESAGKRAAPVTVLVEDPETFGEREELEPYWQTTRMIANLPHVEANFRSGIQQTARSAMFLIDSGAGGVDIMFNERAVNRHSVTLSGSITSQKLKGPGGVDAPALTVQQGQLKRLELKNTSFDNVTCLFTGPNGLEMSLYTAGIICANLMARCTVVVDYARSRMAFVPAPQDPVNDINSP